ncbi:unnamed protein product [Candidula unifasciata]|uniref:Uncharacterized protein n=1 Tax=Candidula unifasciata TaxID=100452 RepID=A0A8S4A8A7_9EUPU|nr:unnamed protein product [Candidula unifasciata]
MSRSASMYNSPYTYKPPPPRIDYPSFCYGCRDITCRYVLDSKLLALSVLLLLGAIIVVVISNILPFWFTLAFNGIDGTFGTNPLQEHFSIESGLFFLKASEFDNLLFTDTFTGRDAVPKLLQAAQFFAVFGSCILVPCFPAGLILMFRQLSSPTALIILAGAVSLSAASEILVVVLSGCVFGASSCDPYAGDGCNYRDNLAWRMLPIYSQMYRVEPHTTPYVTPSWGWYIAIIGAALTLVAAVFFWIETFKTVNTLGTIRYQQLRQARDPFENDIDPYVGKKFTYQAPLRQGPNTYGMQPVVSGAPYGGVVLSSDSRGGYVPPVSFSSYEEPPRYNEKHGPPSTVSGSSGPIVSREIDL